MKRLIVVVAIAVAGCGSGGSGVSPVTPPHLTPGVAGKAAGRPAVVVHSTVRTGIAGKAAGRKP